MKNDIDYNKLRNDLKDYYGTAAYSGFPIAICDVSRVTTASNEDLIKEATRNSLDLNKYKKNTW